MILTLISLVLLTAYIAYAVSVIKTVPWSLSDTYYQLKKRARPAWLFQIAMIVPAMLLMPAWLEQSLEKYQFLAFLSCGGLMFVGTAPCFKLELEGMIHYAATAVCGVAAVSWVCLMGMWYVPVVLFAVAICLIAKYKRWMFWVEVAAFVSTYVGVTMCNI